MLRSAWKYDMYDHRQIDKKWQESWEASGLYRSQEDQAKPKCYVLDMFPYPSGTGLHVGHPKGYIASDIFARLKMMQGYSVLHPMGFDAFGLPAENYAIANKVHPRQAVAENIATYKAQLKKLAFSYDWSREVQTTDPEYYRWTQWIFLQMYKQGLAYESDEPINWCPSCRTGLANEDLEDGRCERCGSEVVQKPLRQWVLRITDYAERLLEDLDKLSGWEESIKEMQRNWIGRSQGTELDFSVSGSDEKIRVFTTRLDTVFGCTYVVLAPEHKLVSSLKPLAKNQVAIDAYLEQASRKTSLERADLNKEKTGIELEGILAINPFNQEAIKVFIADYVLASYGTGAVMAVPAHDERDFEFAKQYGLEIRHVVEPKDSKAPLDLPFCSLGRLKDSGEFSGLESTEAIAKMSAWLEENNLGRTKVHYKLKDWVFSRQRYWGEPIPLVHCPKCGVVPLPEDQLPLTLPEVSSYEPTGTGESPLAAIEDWVNTTCPACGGPAKRETNTMPQWAGSCWYYLRYMDPINSQALVSPDKEKYWSPVDLYVGGAEHATRHLIYARFWHKFLYDIKVVSQAEPFLRLQHVGLIMGEDGRKMSKRWGNVVNPDEMVERFGADALRVYTMFMGPFDQAANWSTSGLIGCRKFLDKAARLCETNDGAGDDKIRRRLHKTIKKVGEDIEAFRFNTAVSALMILTNEISDYIAKNGRWPLDREERDNYLLILAPFAPYLAEELWESKGKTASIFLSAWPKFNPEFIQDEIFNLVVQVNGKLRASLPAPAGISEDEALALASQDEAVKRQLEGKAIKKKIFVPDKLLNLVVA